MKCIQDIHISKNKSQKRQVKNDNTQLVFFVFFSLTNTGTDSFLRQHKFIIRTHDVQLVF